ncbi:MAG: hypothetical protein EOP09_03085 [Proteobacteria bacterium]|nr:MAG: hypothetical protein EOP09_03085 [Pseudomonadota bacterium]
MTYTIIKNKIVLFASLTVLTLGNAQAYSGQEDPITTEASIHAQIQLSRAQADKSMRDMQKMGTGIDINSDDYLDWVHVKNKHLELALTQFDQYFTQDLIAKMKPWMARYNAIAQSSIHSPTQKEVLLGNLHIKVREYVKSEIAPAYHRELGRVFAVFLPAYFKYSQGPGHEFARNLNRFTLYEMTPSGWQNSVALSKRSDDMDEGSSLAYFEKHASPQLQSGFRGLMTTHCKSEICYGLIAAAIRSFNEVFAGTLNRQIELQLADMSSFEIPAADVDARYTIRYLVETSSRPEKGLPYDYKK